MPWLPRPTLPWDILVHGDHSARILSRVGYPCAVGVPRGCVFFRPFRGGPVQAFCSRRTHGFPSAFPCLSPSWYWRWNCHNSALDIGHCSGNLGFDWTTCPVGLGLGHGVRLTSELTTSFPIPLINLLDKVSEVVVKARFPNSDLNHRSCSRNLVLAHFGIRSASVPVHNRFIPLVVHVSLFVPCHLMYAPHSPLMSLVSPLFLTSS
jgi:hypothetical protein